MNRTSIAPADEQKGANINVRVTQTEKQGFNAVGALLDYRTEADFFRAIAQAVISRSPEQVMEFIDPVLSNSTSFGLGNVLHLKMLATVPAGPWEPAVANAEDYPLSGPAVADLEIQEGDVLITINGQSMEGAKIPDGATVVVRPIPEGRYPKNGTPVVVQIEDENGECWGTLKHWYSPSGREPATLRDGNGDLYPTPPNARSIRPVARAVAVMFQL
jgi:SOS-response transcriptional repressor LexA